MMQYQFSESDFYKQYLKVRVLYNNPTHKISLQGKITDKHTKQPIVDVTVTVKIKTSTAINTVDEKTPKKRTTAKGNYQFRKLNEGVYTITYEKYGYQTKTIDLKIFKNKGYRRNVKLVVSN